MNGVFLVALCLSIFLEAIKRFVEPQEVGNPQLVLIVGCFGLLSNILGLLLFHEHGHSHGGDSHGHTHGAANDESVAEEGRKFNCSGSITGPTSKVADEGGNIAEVLPQNTVAGWGKPGDLSKLCSGASSKRRPQGYSRSDEDDSTMTNSTSPLSFRKPGMGNPSNRRQRRRHGSGSRSRFSSVDDIHIHPASFRNEIIAASRLEDIESQAGSDSGGEDETNQLLDENTPLLPGSRESTNGYTRQDGAPENSSHDRHDSWHIDHRHNKPKENGHGGHSHSDLNMRGVFLHVMGDALGNIGVIASALVMIWLTTWKGRFYADPAISLAITFIILGSAIPLCKAAARILLQAVPAGINVDDIKDDISELPGIVSCHHLHVWQLSDIKLVASLHIEVGFDFKGEGSARYMQLARAVRRCLHEYGIHSSTIQPEFCLDVEPRDSFRHHSEDEGGSSEAATKKGSRGGSRAPSSRSQTSACLLDCGDECDEGGQCCSLLKAKLDKKDLDH